MSDRARKHWASHTVSLAQPSAESETVGANQKLARTDEREMVILRFLNELLQLR